MIVFTGCGGWGYFKVPGNRLQAYARAYDFVETNSTFYRKPTEQQVRTWRATVPAGFEFTVKANSVLTHDEALRPTARAFKAYDRMRHVCRELGASVLVLQTAPGFDTSPRDVKDLFTSVDTNGITLVWEPRGKNSPTYLTLARDLGMTPSVDISIQEPPPGEDVLYTRIFGPDRTYDIPGDCIKKIDENLKASGAKKAYVTFHGSKMYKDAARFLVYRKDGK